MSREQARYNARKRKAIESARNSRSAQINKQFEDVRVDHNPTHFRVTSNRFDPSQYDVVNSQGFAVAACFDNEAAAQAWIDGRRCE